MGRILFFVALAAAMWIAWTLSRKRNSLDNEERRELKRLRAKEREAQRHSREPAGEVMVKCEHCGLYFPKREAVLSKEHVYCSKRCRDASRTQQ